MKGNYKIIFLILGAFVLGWSVHAQEVDVDWYLVNVDSSSSIDSRHFNESELLAYTSDSRYEYTTKPQEDVNWWERFKRWFYEKFIRPLFYGAESESYGVLRYILGALAVAVICYMLAKSRSKNRLVKQDKTWGAVYANPTEVHETQFLKWIMEAEEEERYDKALKFLYLWTINQLDKKNYIVYRPTYTNRQVVRKLKDQKIKALFQSVSRHFEHVYYGHFTIDKDAFTQLKSKTLNSSLK